MLITAVESSVVSMPFTMGGPHSSFAGQRWDRMEILLVRVETADGLVGWGEAFGHAAIASTKAALDTIVAPLVVGRDSADIAGLTRRVLHAVHLLGRNGPFVYAFSGIEIALWDIMGKRCGQPVWRLLGGAAPASLPAYASLLSYGGDLGLVARNTADAVAPGLPPHQAARADPRRGAGRAIRRPRGAHHARRELRLDPAGRPRHGGMLAGDGLLWLEEPVWPPEDAAGLASLRRHGIPLSAGENTAGLFGFKALIEAGAIDIAQPSVTKVGGIGEMVRVIRLCEAAGVAVTPHSPYFGPGFVATLHIAAALVEHPLVEVLWLEMDPNPFDPWVRSTNGRVAVPTGPGLGSDPDPALLARTRLGTPTRITA